jgi:hypothetical protein
MGIVLESTAEKYKCQRDKMVKLAFELCTWLDGQPCRYAEKQVHRMLRTFEEEETVEKEHE